MLLKYFYDERLAQASYLVGCQTSKQAVVIDPARNIAPYIEAAEKHGMSIVGALETHIHADFVSGARELAETLNATLYLSDEGGQDWKYQYVDHLPHRLLKDGDDVKIGNLIFEVIHTPGHTPESLSFILTDGGGHADQPMGIFTGDFVFADDIGRPDLLEKVAGAQGAANAGAHEMFESLEKFRELPDYMQVWPGHGAGSACGKSLGAIPSSTVGYEKRFNWAFQHTSRDLFVEALLDGQPEPPTYFAVMKQMNKTGPALLANVPATKEMTDIVQLEESIRNGAQVIDTREPSLFAKDHLKGTINLPFRSSFATWAGWIVDYQRPLYVLANPAELDDIKETLHSIGIDQIPYAMDADKAVASSSARESYQNISPKEANALLQEEHAQILDVRYLNEWKEGHIEGAKHMMLGTIPDRLDEIPAGRPVIVQCGSGVRSAIGASLLQAAGIKVVYNMTGGYAQWKKDVQDENKVRKL
ncbi:rhodanese-like domain-containing protein [Bacillus sonorensis]|uniref:rhodanese-like domain-containing protein n=1 Tax=Bacillus sonorensis TaxID=119858 RepID=UPI002DB865D3|nr:rhodanese-like domain-containing protein [Bacillus sonorensis]MEC1354753.1 rhodanese-like domain-containing protein [Bacillus sonorensis]MEC1426954.1 rhodanese-like domain-containing protein [Bacillus sonorensis]MEC1439296.1 rhodanese-like domain-containing protein [Bacillus sonorensis]